MRDAWRSLVDSVRQDVTFAFRQIRRSPLLATAAVASLGVGIGATAGVFTVADAALLGDLPIARPGDLSVLEWRAPQWPKVAAWTAYRDPETGGRIGGSFSYHLFRLLSQEVDKTASVAALQRIPPVSLLARGLTRTAESLLVSGRFFDTIGVRPAAGRLLQPADDMPDAPPVAVVSHRLWQTSLGGDTAAIGSVLTINGHPFTVVGVADRSFFGVRPGTWVDVYLPVTTGLAVDPEIARRQVSPLANAGLWWLQLIARRSPGTDVAALERRLDEAFGRGLDRELLRGLQHRPELRLRPGRRGYGFLVRDTARPVAILMALSSLVLLLACLNVGNLLLAKASGRRHEWAMRLALGAGRRRVARQLLTEGTLLGICGGLVGLLLAGPSTRAFLLLFAAGRDDRWYDVGLDWRTVGFGAAVSLLASILLGVIPAIGLRSVPLTLLRASRELRGGWRHRQRLAGALVATQIALSLAMLIASGLLVRSLGNLYAVPLGFNPDRILLFDVDPVRAGYGGARRQELLDGIRRALEGVPQIRMSTRSSAALVDDQARGDIIRIPGRPVSIDSVAYLLEVGPGFHETLQIPLRMGRTIGEHDAATTSRVAVVNESFVRSYFPGESPIGCQILVDYPQEGSPFTIVGVVGNTKYASLREAEPLPIVYLPDTQRPRATGTVVAARVTGDPGPTRLAIVEAIRRTYPMLPLVRLRTFGDQFGERLATDRLLSILSAAFAMVALALASLGLYGVMAHAVARRTGEIGLRAALGATAGMIMRLVLKDCVLVVVPGVAAGLGLALAATRLLRSHLFGLTPADPATLAASVAAVIAVALVATCVPARRATRVDPTQALRSE